METAEQNTYPDSLATNETREGFSTVPSNDDILRSIDGITNHIYEKPPGDYVLLSDKTPQRDEACLNFEEEPSKEHRLVHDKISNDGVPSHIYENSPSGNSPSEEIDSVITEEEDACVLEDEPSIQGATPSESNDKLAGPITVKVSDLRHPKKPSAEKF